ncbi:MULTISPECIES: AraC family transcriptional regulator [unclassified Halomonas]|uniref:helix-turn-helix transcriptional regulator n=1 Tax=unclassified Halomonas TaxID=2609666 RepID=UPI001EF3FD0C|nr:MULTISPECIES: AraC family transcriptional regulator [unclassified Halomonas]MCP1344069.1 AraC family transcriptional regulator [Halomonas sp. FL8]MCP1360433.1 AraC family transcriptional regulator [Halomonas sp. BBD45]
MAELDRPLGEARSYPAQVLTDRHAYHQVLVGLEGTVELETGRGGVHVAPGVLAPIAEGEVHHYLAAGDNRCLVLDLPVAWCDALGMGALVERRAYRLSPALRERARHLAGAGNLALVEWLEASLVCGGRQVAMPRLRLMRLLPEVLATLERPWRVGEMAARCHLAEAAFARQFRALVGQAPHAWLTERRLERACRLMAEPQASLTEIAVACGFADAAHFSRTFRAQHGLSPRQWRQDHAGPTRASNALR